MIDPGSALVAGRHYGFCRKAIGDKWQKLLLNPMPDEEPEKKFDSGLALRTMPVRSSRLISTQDVDGWLPIYWQSAAAGKA